MSLYKLFFGLLSTIFWLVWGFWDIYPFYVVSSKRIKFYIYLSDTNSIINLYVYTGTEANLMIGFMIFQQNVV